MSKQIISKKSLNAVQELVIFMKQGVRRREAFQGPGHVITVRQIANELQRGGNNLRMMLDDGLVTECAAALENFLMNLKYPFIPAHIQALALDDTEGIPPEVVAEDVLGLLKQDVSGRHYSLIVIVLDLLHFLLKHTPADELTGYNIPISMLPVFFNLQAQHISQWRRVATVFVELIRMAPTHLEFTVENDFGDDMFFENFKKEILFTASVRNVIGCIDALNIINVLDFSPRRYRNFKSKNSIMKL